MKKYLIFVLFVLIASLTFSQPSAKKLDALFDRLEQKNAFNGNILIAKHGQMIYKRSVGYADVKTGRLNDDSTVFELASVGKQFTAMAILILKDKGELQLDDPVISFLDSFPYPDITIRHLLNHTSGLKEYYGEDVEWNPAKVATNEDVLKGFSRLKPPLKFTPGNQFEYVNAGYVFLASIVERVSGKPFGQFVSDEIFKPLKMTQTRSYTTRWSRGEILAHYGYPYLYLKAQNQYISPTEVEKTRYMIAMSGIEGDGSIVSSTLDLLTWENELRNPTLVSPATMAEAFEPATLNDGKLSYYGFGWFLTKNGKKQWHWGSWPGCQTSFTRYEKNGITVMYMKNVESYDWSWLKELEKMIRS